MENGEQIKEENKKKRTYRWRIRANEGDQLHRLQRAKAKKKAEREERAGDEVYS